LNAFFGYSAQPFFDPRVIFDSVWSRWCITAPAFPNSATSQILGIACSANGDALGGWHVYLVDLGFLGGSGGFYDFPMIGDSQDAIIFTANVFTSSTFQGSSLFAIRKARVFTGRNIGGEPIYTGLQATLQPARELLDGNGYAWLAAANGSGNIAMYAMGYPASPPDTTLNGYNVTVNPYAAPPAAPQQSPCTGATNNLDTSDARFVNTGVQNGDLYYQVHTITDITATPRYYIIKGLLSFTPTVQEFGEFYANATSSSDFNASIGADGGNRVVVNWTSVDAANHVNPQVRFSGKLPTDGLIAGPGTVLTTSAACLSGNYDPNFGEQRWGDYSQSVVGPTSPQFWIENETVVNTNTWGTEIGMIHF
jgi:hypothetical protein